MSLADIITALEAEDPTRILPIGFDGPHSYRGDYADLAFEPAADISIGDMLAAARSAVNATYEGWKGGDYTMDVSSDCWLSTEGHSSGEFIGSILLELLLQQGPVEPELERLRAENARLRAALQRKA